MHLPKGGVGDLGGLRLQCSADSGLDPQHAHVRWATTSATSSKILPGSCAALALRRGATVPTSPHHLRSAAFLTTNRTLGKPHRPRSEAMERLGCRPHSLAAVLTGALTQVLS